MDDNPSQTRGNEREGCLNLQCTSAVFMRYVVIATRPQWKSAHYCYSCAKRKRKKKKTALGSAAHWRCLHGIYLLLKRKNISSEKLKKVSCDIFWYQCYSEIKVKHVVIVNTCSADWPHCLRPSSRPITMWSKGARFRARRLMVSILQAFRSISYFFK